VALYFRLTLPESPRYTIDVEGDPTKAYKDAHQFLGRQYDSNENEIMHPTKKPHTWKEFRQFFGCSRNFKLLIGTVSGWFLIDVAVYGIGLNNSTILNAIGFAGSGSSFSQVKSIF